jgi:hypothetical protein
VEICFKNRQTCSLWIIVESEDIAPITSRRLQLSHLPYDVFGFLPTPMKSKCGDRERMEELNSLKKYGK